MLRDRSEGILKEELQSNNFDLLYLVYSSLLNEFSEYGHGVIPYKKLYWFCGVRWRFKRGYTKQLLRALAKRYSLKLTMHGARLQ